LTSEAARRRRRSSPGARSSSAAQLLRVRDAQRTAASVPARRAGTVMDRAALDAGSRAGRASPRRDPVHDPRRGHGLGAGRRGQLGRHGPDDVEFRKPVPLGRHPRRTAGSRPTPSRHRNRWTDRRRRHRYGARPPTGTLRRGTKDASGAARTGYGFRAATARVSGEAEQRRRWRFDDPTATARTRSPRASRPMTSPRPRPRRRPRRARHRARRRLVAERKARAEALGRGWPTTSATPTGFATRCGRRSSSWPIPSTSRASTGRPGSGPSRVRWPLLAADRARYSAATRRDAPHLAAVVADASSASPV
jgi:hypothetical protein